MVLAVRVVLLGSMLLSSAYAAEQGVAQGTTAQSQAQEKAVAIQQEPPVGQKARTLRKKVHKPAVEKAEPKTTGKQDGAMETPIESSQSVQLRGVRG